MCVLHVPNTDNAVLHSQHCTGFCPRGGEDGHLQSVVISPSSFFSNYELSRASRTFMICCLMTLVASPALGIKYLRSGNKRENKKIKNCKWPLQVLFCFLKMKINVVERNLWHNHSWQFPYIFRINWQLLNSLLRCPYDTASKGHLWLSAANWSIFFIIVG